MPLTTFSTGTLLGSVLWAGSSHRLWQNFEVWGRQEKGGKWVTGHSETSLLLHIKDLGDDESTVSKGNTWKQYSWCLPGVPLAGLWSTDMIYASRVGRSPLCVDRMWTALGKHTAGNETSTPFPSLFLRSSWPTCVLLQSRVCQALHHEQHLLSLSCSLSNGFVTQIYILLLRWLSWFF